MTHHTAQHTAAAIGYRQGVADVIAIARRSALALETAGKRPLHHGFAIDALRALADEAEALTREPAKAAVT